MIAVHATALKTYQISHEDARIIIARIDRVAAHLAALFSDMPEHKRVLSIELGHDLADLKKKLEPYQ